MLVTQSCPTLHPIDCSPPGSSVHGILQQEYWSGFPFPSPGCLPHPGIKLWFPALSNKFFTVWATREAPRGRMDTCTCMVESLRCSPETITTLLISYTEIQNKKLKKKKKGWERDLYIRRDLNSVSCLRQCEEGISIEIKWCGYLEGDVSWAQDGTWRTGSCSFPWVPFTRPLVVVITVVIYFHKADFTLEGKLWPT